MNNLFSCCHETFDAPALPPLEPPFGKKIRPRLRLGEVERRIRSFGLVSRTPSRQTLIRMIQRGELDGGRMRLGIESVWVVYEDSLLNWAGLDVKMAA